MRILASLIVLAAPFVVYFYVIRPRLKARFSDTYAHIDDWWQRQLARLYAFRTFLVGSAGAFVAVLPNLLESLAGFDFSFLPQPWPLMVGTAVGVIVPMMRAFSTTPIHQPEE